MLTIVGAVVGIAVGEKPRLLSLFETMLMVVDLPTVDNET